MKSKSPSCAAASRVHETEDEVDEAPLAWLQAERTLRLCARAAAAASAEIAEAADAAVARSRLPPPLPPPPAVPRRAPAPHRCPRLWPFPWPSLHPSQYVGDSSRPPQKRAPREHPTAVLPPPPPLAPAASVTRRPQYPRPRPRLPPPPAVPLPPCCRAYAVWEGSGSAPAKNFASESVGAKQNKFKRNSHGGSIWEGVPPGPREKL